MGSTIKAQTQPRKGGAKGTKYTKEEKKTRLSGVFPFVTSPAPNHDLLSKSGGVVYLVFKTGFP
jgi:hypothetical protein